MLEVIMVNKNVVIKKQFTKLCVIPYNGNKYAWEN